MDDRRLLRRWEFWAALATILSFFVVFTQLIFQIRDVRRSIRSVEKDVERVEGRIVRNRFRITYPSDGNTVEFTDLVRGITPYSDRNNYVVVTPVETGDDRVQDGPLKVYTGGLWIGRVRFGTAAAGPGQRFVVRGIATKSILPPRSLTEVPADAIFSEPITVIRKK